MEALFHLGPMCQKTLGEKLLKSGGNVTVIVDNLEKRRLVQRTRDSADRRLITVSLTDAGRETISRIIPDHVRRVVSEMSTLTSKQQEQLSALCRAVGTRQAP
jgi:MarR family 2-MHQ and catechol resistance regulon transcriptional repressor